MVQVIYSPPILQPYWSEVTSHGTTTIITYFIIEHYNNAMGTDVCGTCKLYIYMYMYMRYVPNPKMDENGPLKIIQLWMKISHR